MLRLRAGVEGSGGGANWPAVPQVAQLRDSGTQGPIVGWQHNSRFVCSSV